MKAKPGEDCSMRYNRTARLFFFVVVGVAQLAGCGDSLPAVAHEPVGDGGVSDGGSDATPDDTPSLGDALRDRLASVSPEFWGAVLVTTSSGVQLSEGYGFADYKDTPMTAQALFDVGSVSKQFTAAAILKCEMQGLLDIDDSIDTVFVDVPSDKSNITIFHLLTHTSGISVDSMYAALENAPVSRWSTRKGYVEVNLGARMSTAPGTGFEYSNPGYGLLAAIVEIVSQQSLEEYTREHLFAPAGMLDSGFVQDSHLDTSLFTTRHAQPEFGFYSAAPVVEYWTGWGSKGATGVISSIQDLHRWIQALRDDRVLSQQLRQRLFTPHLQKYALGWFVEDNPRRKVHHSGSTVGYLTYLAMYPEDESAIVVLSNWDSDTFAIESALADVVFAAQKVSPPSQVHSEIIH